MPKLNQQVTPYSFSFELGTLEEELDAYFKLYKIHLTPDRLTEYRKQLEAWHKQGKSIYRWLYDIIAYIKEFKCGKRPHKYKIKKPKRKPAINDPNREKQLRYQREYWHKYGKFKYAKKKKENS